MPWTGFETTTTEPQRMHALTITANRISGDQSWNLHRKLLTHYYRVIPCYKRPLLPRTLITHELLSKITLVSSVLISWLFRNGNSLRCVSFFLTQSQHVKWLPVKKWTLNLQFLERDHAGVVLQRVDVQSVQIFLLFSPAQSIKSPVGLLSCAGHEVRCCRNVCHGLTD